MVIKIRGYTYSDLPKVVTLLNESNKDQYEFRPFTEKTLRSSIDERGFKIVIAEENGIFLGSAAYNYGQWGEEIRWLTVIETPNPRLIQDALVSEAEKYVLNGKVFTTVDAESLQIAQWRERGYELEGGLYHLVAPLNGVKPLPVTAEGLALRTLYISEEADFIKIVNDGFGWQRLRANAVQEWKRDFPGFDENWIHVADYRGKVVSTVVAKEDLNFNTYFKGKRGYLGPAATLPGFRCRNLATALTQEAMNFLCRKGMDSVALHTHEQNVASMALLKKLGFRITHHWSFMQKSITRRA
jgi:ribosomal protein S18 acetylase RimI-like enzyme